MAEIIYKPISGITKVKFELINSYSRTRPIALKDEIAGEVEGVAWVGLNKQINFSTMDGNRLYNVTGYCLID